MWQNKICKCLRELSAMIIPLKFNTGLCQKVGFFREIPKFLFFIRVVKTYSTEVFSSIINANSSTVCTSQPYCCEENCFFIVDWSQLADAHDIICDDLGSWTNTGVHSIYANVTFSSDKRVEKVHIFRQGRPKVM